MALPSMFHRRGGGAVVDRDHDGVDDRESPTVDRKVVDRKTPVIDRDRDGIDDRAQPPVAPVVAPERERPDRERPNRERVVAPTAPPAPVRTSRTSFLATLGLCVGLASTFASLTGRLAPVGIALGVVGLLLALGGVMASGRTFVNGRGVAYLGLLFAIAGIVFGALAMNDTSSWLDSDVNQVDHLRTWLDNRFSFLDSM